MMKVVAFFLLFALTGFARATDFENVECYTHRIGDCPNHDIGWELTSTTLDACATACSDNRRCKTFLFVDQGADSYCWMKDSECPDLTRTHESNFHFYNKKENCGEVGPDFCKDKTDGDYPDPSNPCGFVTCSNNIPYPRDCPTLLVWNAQAGYCDFDEDVLATCPTQLSMANRPVHVYNQLRATPEFENVKCYTHRIGDCPNHDIGSKITSTTLDACAKRCSDNPSCKTFLFVDQGADGYCWLKDSECPDLTRTHESNFHFYNKKENCGEVGPDYCIDKPEGDYPDPSNPCGFVICSNGRPYQMDCADGLVWNSQAGYCDYGDSAVCSSR